VQNTVLASFDVALFEHSFVLGKPGLYERVHRTHKPNHESVVLCAPSWLSARSAERMPIFFVLVVFAALTSWDPLGPPGTGRYWANPGSLSTFVERANSSRLCSARRAVVA